MISRRQLVQTLIDAGYRRVSNAFGHVARVDREDWKEHMAQKHAPWDPSGTGMEWVRCLENNRMASDFYRRDRSLTEDVLVLPPEFARRIPTSSHDPVGFIPPKQPLDK